MKSKTLLLVALGFTLFESINTSLYAVNNPATNPVVFDSVDYSKGFDPTEATSTDCTFWTSVCRVPHSLGPGGDLNINNHIIVKFPSSAEAANYVIQNDDVDMLTLVVSPTDPQGRRALTITGKPHGRASGVPAGIRVYSNSVNPKTPGNEIATLKVHVLPLRTVSLGIWRVWDSRSADPLVDPPIPSSDPRGIATVPVVQAAFDYCNKVYRPSCIVFSAVTNPGDIDAPYENYPLMNGRLDLPLTQWTGHPLVELLALQAPIPRVAEVNIAIVWGFARYISASSYQVDINTLGVTILGKSISMVQAFAATGNLATQTIQLTCAHEIGHQLELSKRQPHNPNPMETLLANEKADHDTGPFPQDGTLKYWAGLLYPKHYVPYPPPPVGPPSYVLATEWTSRHDWLNANVTISAKGKNWLASPP